MKDKILKFAVAFSLLAMPALASSVLSKRTVPDNSVTSAKIVNGAVTDNDLANGSVTSLKIVDGAVIEGDLANDSVTSAKIAAAAVTDNDLANGSVTSIKIVDGAVNLADLSANSVNSSKIVDGAVDSIDITDAAIVNADVADNTIKTAKLAAIDVPADEECATYEGGNIEWQTCGGGGATPPFDDNDLAPGSVGSLQVANSTLTLETGDDTPVLVLGSAGPLSATARLSAGAFFLDNDGSIRVSTNLPIKQSDGTDAFTFNETGDMEFFQRGARFESGFGLTFANDTLLTATSSVFNLSVNGSTSEFNIDTNNNLAELTGVDFGIDSDKKLIFDGAQNQTVYLQYVSGNPSLDLVGTSLTVQDGKKIEFGGSGSGEAIYTDANITPDVVFIDGAVDMTGTSVTVDQNLILSGIATGTGTVLVRNGSNEVVLSTESYVTQNSDPTFGDVTVDLLTATDTDIDNLSVSAATVFPPQSIGAGNASINDAATFVHKTAITGGGDTLTMPSPGVAGKIVIIMDTSGTAGTNNITIAPFGSELFNGAASASITLNYGVLRLQSDGSNWFAF